MRLFAHILFGVMAGAGMGAPASAAFRAALADGSGGRAWEMLAVEFPRTPGMVDVSVRDARGGLAILRRVPGDAGVAWISLPLESASGLSGGQGGTWPVDVVLRSVDGKGGGRELERDRVALVLGTGGGWRMAVPGSLSPAASAITVRVSEEDILWAPALIFAGCDLVFLTPELQTRMTQTRALELLAVGVRLAAPAEGPAGPPAGELSKLVWERSRFLPGATLWTTAAAPVRRPALVEPGLGRFAESASPIAVPTGVRTALLLAGPLAVVMLVVNWGLFRRRRTALAMSALSLAVVTCGIVVYLRVNALRQEPLAQWRQAMASDTAAVGGVMLEERLMSCEALFAAPVAIAAEPGRQLFPVAASLDEYWALRRLQLSLAGEMQLTGTLPARTALRFETRRAAIMGLLPAFPQTVADRGRLFESLHVPSDDAWWLLGGYVKPAAAPDEPGVLLSTWATSKPWMAGGQANRDAKRLAWYDMRFEQGHRYLLFERDGMMNVVDYGLPAAAAQESRGVP